MRDINSTQIYGIPIIKRTAISLNNKIIGVNKFRF